MWKYFYQVVSVGSVQKGSLTNPFT